MKKSIRPGDSLERNILFWKMKRHFIDTKIIIKTKSQQQQKKQIPLLKFALFNALNYALSLLPNSRHKHLTKLQI